MITPTARESPRLFYVYMAAAFVVIAFGGFLSTFWLPLAAGSFSAHPAIYLHGALFSAWTLFVLAQAVLVASGRTLKHRDWGLAGISLATAMVFSGIIAAIDSINVADAFGQGDAGRRFSIVSLSAALLFACTVGAAIANVRNPERHKRWMILATIPLLQAPVGRILRPIFAPGDLGPPPVFVTIPAALAVDLLIVVAAAYDWRTRGRPHPVYLAGGLVIVATQLLRAPASTTEQWMRVASWFQGLAG